ncbi:MAG: hypothetical protein KF851_12740 [Pirellulaceae bacterium]|nr:hypothetical protein [Pirellulaceae bacterium]
MAQPAQLLDVAQPVAQPCEVPQPFDVPQPIMVPQPVLQLVEVYIMLPQFDRRTTRKVCWLQQLLTTLVPQFMLPQFVEDIMVVGIAADVIVLEGIIV